MAQHSQRRSVNNAPQSHGLITQRERASHPLQSLQQAIGNRAVTSLLQSHNRPSSAMIQRACACQDEQQVSRLVDDMAISRLNNSADNHPVQCACNACKQQAAKSGNEEEGQFVARSQDSHADHCDCDACGKTSVKGDAEASVMREETTATTETTTAETTTPDTAELTASPEAAMAALSGAPGGMVCNIPDYCPAEFCTPYPSSWPLAQMRDAAAPILLAGIAVKVNPRVVGLWSDYLYGGSGVQNLSGQFGADFSASVDTAEATQFILARLRHRLKIAPPTFPSGENKVEIDIPSTVPKAAQQIGTPDDPHEMNFGEIEEVPGNIAGGIGRTQTTCPVGAQPAPSDDDRRFEGKATVTRLPNGHLFVVPSIQFTVVDNIDLCPGDCGAPREQVATIPLSRFEASGISGDMPFVVNFPALAAPFVVIPDAQPEPAGPVNGTITASSLRIREQPNTNSAILGSYPRGTSVELACQVEGEEILGNNIWNQTDQGYISDRYVSREGGEMPADC